MRRKIVTVHGQQVELWLGRNGCWFSSRKDAEFSLDSKKLQTLAKQVPDMLEEMGLELPVELTPDMEVK